MCILHISISLYIKYILINLLKKNRKMHQITNQASNLKEEACNVENKLIPD